MWAAWSGTSVQITRRLRALLEELRKTVRPEHRAAIDDELARLDADVAGHWSGSADLDRAGAADHQGLGEPTHSPARA